MSRIDKLQELIERTTPRDGVMGQVLRLRAGSRGDVALRDGPVISNVQLPLGVSEGESVILVRPQGSTQWLALKVETGFGVGSAGDLPGHASYPPTNFHVVSGAGVAIWQWSSWPEFNGIFEVQWSISELHGDIQTIALVNGNAYAKVVTNETEWVRVRSVSSTFVPSQWTDWVSCDYVAPEEGGETPGTIVGGGAGQVAYWSGEDQLGGSYYFLWTTNREILVGIPAELGEFIEVSDQKQANYTSTKTGAIIGQSFTSSLTGESSGISVHVAGTATGTLYVRTGENIAGALVASQAFSINNAEADWENIEFDTPGAIVAGAVYCFVFEVDTGSLDFGVTFPGSYSGGRCYDTDAWDSDYDLAFYTYVNLAPTANFTKIGEGLVQTNEVIIGGSGEAVIDQASVANTTRETGANLEQHFTVGATGFLHKITVGLVEKTVPGTSTLTVYNEADEELTSGTAVITPDTEAVEDSIGDTGTDFELVYETTHAGVLVAYLTQGVDSSDEETLWEEEGAPFFVETDHVIGGEEELLGFSWGTTDLALVIELREEEGVVQVETIDFSAFSALPVGCTVIGVKVEFTYTPTADYVSGEEPDDIWEYTFDVVDIVATVYYTEDLPKVQDIEFSLTPLAVTEDDLLYFLIEDEHTVQMGAYADGEAYIDSVLNLYDFDFSTTVVLVGDMTGSVRLIKDGDHVSLYEYIDGAYVLNDYFPFQEKGANLFYAGPAVGSDAKPTWRYITESDVSVALSGTPWMANRIILTDGATWASYDNDNAGMLAALGDAEPGMLLWRPPGELSDDFTIPTGLSVVGMNRETCIFTGTVTLSDAVAISTLSILRTVNTADNEFALIAPAEGTAYVRDCTIICIQEGAGIGVGIFAMGEGSLGSGILDPGLVNCLVHGSTQDVF